MVVVLSGGAGGGRFCRGVVRAVPEADVTIVGNTADDIDVYGVRVSPDLDLITFTLAGVIDRERGYGLEGDPRSVMAELAAHGVDTWFDLGDRDFALCVARSRWLADGEPLHVATDRIARRFGVRARILPMSDDPVWTEIATEAGPLHFQEWWVRHRASIPATGVRFAGVEDAKPAPGVLDAIAEADAILIAPSNPVVSVAPILAVPGIRDALAATRAPIVAVTPVVGGAVLRGMADRLLPLVGSDVSVRGVAGLYADLADGFVLDERDASSADSIAALGLAITMCDTIMASDEVTTALARAALDLAGRLRTETDR